MDEKRALLRHSLATLAYRVARTLEDAPEEFASFDGAGRQPVEILAHMGDLFDWAHTAAAGREKWHTSQPLAWEKEQERFFASLKSLDVCLATTDVLHASVERLLQGPVADALTHVGQLTMLRRLSGSPAHGENFYVAEVTAGQVSAKQPAPVGPFRKKEAAG